MKLSNHFNEVRQNFINAVQNNETQEVQNELYSEMLNCMFEECKGICLLYTSPSPRDCS